MPRSEFWEVKSMASRAAALRKEGRPEEARALLEEGLKKYPGNDFLRLVLADVCLELNRLGEAENLADEVLGRDPQHPQALRVRGEAAFRRRDYRGALSFYQPAYEQEENRFHAWHLIRTLIELEELDRALDLCRRWREREPDNRYFRRLEARIYEKMDRDEKAEEALSEPPAGEPEDGFAYGEKIRLRLKEKPPAEAVRELRGILRVGEHGRNPHLRGLLGQQYERMGDYDAACEEYREALDLDPEKEFARRRLGYSLKRLGRGEEALVHLEQAFRSDPSDFYLRSSLLSLYRELGKTEKGIGFFREIIRDNPGFNNLWGAVKKLAQHGKEEDDG